jgi:cytoskeletal protein CcmA (bactofilin family)
MRRLILGLVSVLALLLPGAALAASGPPDRVVIEGDVLVAKGETVGDVVVVDGNVVVRGTVHGDLAAINGDVTIRGTVTGDVVTLAKRATLGRRARIGGDVKWAQDRPVVAPGAVVSGKVKKLGVGSLNTTGFEVAVGFWAIVTISFLLGGLILLLLAPGLARGVVAAARASRGAAIIGGILLFILLPILAVVLLVTVVGTPLGIGLLLALGPLYAIAYIASAIVLGSRIRKAGGVIGGFVIGMLVLRVIALIPILGGLVSLLAVIFGLGSLFVALRRARTV